MIPYLSPLSNSSRLRMFFDTIFDLAILLSIARLSIIVLTSIMEPMIGDKITLFETVLSQKKAIAVSLNTLILVKIYKILYHFLWDHHIKLIDLIEIAATSLIIKMVFDLNYSRWSILLLITLLVSFVVLNYAQQHHRLAKRETEE